MVFTSLYKSIQNLEFKTILIMKLMTIFLLGICIQIHASSNAQKITISEKNAPIQKILKQIHRQTSYQFFYDDKILDKVGKVNLNLSNVNLDEALKACFKDLPLTYQVSNQTIIVKEVITTKSDNLAKQIVAPQSINIKGIVKNENGLPLPGISVFVVGTKKGTITDSNGSFTFSGIDENATIIFSGLNYENLEIKINGKNTFDIVLAPKISSLDEVQIMAYGQTTKRLKTSSIGSIKADVIEKQPVTNPIQALQGRVAGVAITQSTGAVGGGIEIQVRGISTLTAGSQPLIILDGAILPEINRGLATNIGNYMPFGSNSINSINPNDIESMEILKDADATSIYGSRGANGVLLITTKRGKIGATKFNVDISSWVNSATMLPPRLGLTDYLQMRKDAFAMGNFNPATGVAINPIIATANNAPDLITWSQNNATTDWPKFEFGNRNPSQNVQLSLTGGNKTLNFYSSFGYQKQNDITRGSPNLERISGSLNLNHTSANDKLRIALSTSYIVAKLTPSRGGGSGGAASGSPPNMPMQNADGTQWWPLPTIIQSSSNPLVNPLAMEEARTNNVTNNFIGNIDLSYRILKGLSFKTIVGYNVQTIQNDITVPSTSINPLNPGTTLPNLTSAQSTFRSFNFEPQLTFTGKLFEGKGKIDALIGSTFFDRKTTNNSINFNGFTSDLLLNSWAAGSSIGSRTNSSGFYKFNSLFGRVTFNWENKYLVNLTYRTDGSSRFGPKNQWGNFGAVGLGWIFTNEKWMKNKISYLSYGKIRGSYGTAGNDNITDYRYTSLYTSNTYNNSPGLSPSALADSSIGWENSRKIDVALEMGFLNDRITFSVNWFRNLATNLLATTSLPPQTGFSNYITNIPAVVENKGWEFEISTQNLKATSKLKWRTNFNLTLIKNKLIEFPGLATSPFADRLKIGLPVNSPRIILNAEWSQVFERVDPATGLPIFTDFNRDGLINNSDRTFIGSAMPRTFGGLGNTLSYQGFELDIFFQFSRQLATNWLFNDAYPGQLTNPTTEIVGNYWKQPGDVTKYPRLWTGAASNTSTNLLSSIFPFSSATLNDVLYMRLKNLSVSYSLPASIINKAKISKAVVYLRGQNLWTWTSEKLYKDPEITSAKTGQILKTWTVGVQLTF